MTLRNPKETLKRTLNPIFPSQLFIFFHCEDFTNTLSHFFACETKDKEDRYNHETGAYMERLLKYWINLIQSQKENSTSKNFIN